MEVAVTKPGTGTCSVGGRWDSCPLMSSEWRGLDEDWRACPGEMTFLGFAVSSTQTRSLGTGPGPGSGLATPNPHSHQPRGRGLCHLPYAVVCLHFPSVCMTRSNKVSSP